MTIVTTTNDVPGYKPGYKIVRVIGLVRGITARSRNIISNFGGAIQSIFGANAIVAMRYDANEITDGITEVLAHGTAVAVEKA